MSAAMGRQIINWIFKVLVATTHIDAIEKAEKFTLKPVANFKATLNGEIQFLCLYYIICS